MVDLNIDVYVPATDGTFISEAHARISEILQDYDETIELLWIPPAKREPGDQPFAVAKTEPSGKRYIICHSDTCDERLLARVWSMDASKHDIWTSLEASKAAYDAMELKKQMEAFDEAREMSASILASPLHTFKHNGVTYE